LLRSREQRFTVLRVVVETGEGDERCTAEVGGIEQRDPLARREVVETELGEIIAE